jgi:hypothetical protein
MLPSSKLASQKLNTPISQAIAHSQELEFSDRNGDVGLAWQILELPEDLTFHGHNGGTGG